MKILIWVGCILVYSVFVTALGVAGITLGGIPVMLFSLLFVFLPAPALCKAWDRRKARKAEEPVDPAQAAARRERIMAILNSRTTWIVVAFFALIAVSVYSEERGRKLGYTEAWELAYEEGHSDGYYDGYEEAETAAWDDGYTVGLAEGSEKWYESGYADGVEVGAEDGYEDGYNDGVSEYLSEVRFHRRNACFVTISGERYHHWNCSHLTGHRYYIYNIELALSKGYLPCLDCWESGLNELPPVELPRLN